MKFTMIQTRLKIIDGSYHDEIYISSSVITVSDEDIIRNKIGTITSVNSDFVEKETTNIYISYKVRDNRIYCFRYILHE